MKEKISKSIFWITSIVAIAASIYCLQLEQMNDSSLALFVFGIIVNPLFVDWISKKVGLEINDYYYLTKNLLIWQGTLIAFYVAIIIFSMTNKNIIDEKVALQNFESILRMIMYIIYILILFMHKSENKFYKYIIFGFFYFICTILSFASQSISDEIIKILNSITSSELNMETYGLFINDFMEPIKEAILTYIIFDTIIQEQRKTTDEKKDKDTKEKKVLVDEFLGVEVFDEDSRRNNIYNIRVKKR